VHLQYLPDNELYRYVAIAKIYAFYLSAKNTYFIFGNKKGGNKAIMASKL